MNKELFASMRGQMTPSGEARAALAEKLAHAKPRTVPAKRYIAVAACAVVLAAAALVYRAVRDELKWRAIMDNYDPGNDFREEITGPHSYVLMDDPSCWPADDVGVSENTATAGSGDADQDMTPDELTDNLLEAGFTRANADAYLASGWRMTWASWWKFYHLSEESGDRSLEALLDFSQTEGLAVDPGEAEIPGGAYVNDAPAQEKAITAYQSLMARFEADCGPGVYPEWYGGAYIDGNSDCLVVNIVESGYYGADVSGLRAQIEKWAAPGVVSFRSAPYSLNYLRSLQNQVFDAMYALDLPAGCGVNEMTGQVELTLPEVSEEALWELAELDPTDTAILVIVARPAVLTEEPAVSYTEPSAVNDTAVTYSR